MKLLKDILYRAGIEEVIGSTNLAVDNISFDSRKIDKFSLFIAVKGTQSDGHQYIGSCIERGAVAVVCEILPQVLNEKVTYVRVKDSSSALGFIASNFYENPSEKLKLVGVTGTNGKTTTVTLLHNLFRSLGYKVGLLSTVVNKIDNEIIPSTHTTPDAIQLNKLLATMVGAGCSHCFMEVSSHAVVQNRIKGVKFKGGLFTNITHDHIDYHKTFDEYIKAKKGFFNELPSDAFAIVNKDDPRGLIMIQNTKAQTKTFALKSDADFKAKVLENDFDGLNLMLDGNEIWTKLIGSFNAYNILGVYAISIMLGEDKLSVLTAISKLTPVAGRFQQIKTTNNITGIVDYAHTPDALKNVIDTINNIRGGAGKLITVVGCGGDRDREKRPIMAQIACKGSDKVILTSDNPRSELPEEIIAEMQKGVDAVFYKKTISMVDRREAIKLACSMAESGDIILVAGKGHENYQEIKGVKYPFDDMQVLKEMFQILC